MGGTLSTHDVSMISSNIADFLGDEVVSISTRNKQGQPSSLVIPSNSLTVRRIRNKDAKYASVNDLPLSYWIFVKGYDECLVYNRRDRMRENSAFLEGLRYCEAALKGTPVNYPLYVNRDSDKLKVMDAFIEGTKLTSILSILSDLKDIGKK